MRVFDPGRFLEAQDRPAGDLPVLGQAMREIAAGRKRSHWMWFVFPQLDGLGRSETARFYALASLDDAALYLRHAVLGARLLAATDAALAHADLSATALFGSPDDLKFHASMTVFARAAGGEGGTFARALAQFFDGREHGGTLALLAGR